MLDLVSDFDYNLPSSLIAQEPTSQRDACRLLFLAKKDGRTSHGHFSDIVEYLKPGDLLVLNNSKVFPARLQGYKEKTGGELEVFLHQSISAGAKSPTNLKGQINKENIWEVLIRGRAREGGIIIFPQGLRATIIKNEGGGVWLVRFNFVTAKFWRVVNKIGLVPLPPYIKRRAGVETSDKKNYQTVFAAKDKLGSAAAPTAGLHFTKKILKKIASRGVEIASVTLHVGLGTFAPLKTEKISEHQMHRELVFLEPTVIKKILAAKTAGRRIVAVGTTSCRVLESLAAKLSAAPAEFLTFKEQSFWTDIFIRPGYQFKLTDALITNFHLPKSTLLMLVSALAGKKNIDVAYQDAIKANYRFFSYGDAMFIY
jgi:S-adenosylmethionine:tRNA ribosyltransferase-isomerase